MSRIPVRIITGFLGSGKTTLLNRLLNDDHGLGRVGIIENEYGEVNIDSKIVRDSTLTKSDDEIIELSNGCLCCTVRGDLKQAVLDMVKKSPTVDSIILESSGVADPGPVVQTFLGDKEVAAVAELRGIITVVDSIHITEQISRDKQVASQVAFADLILLNKIDLFRGDNTRPVASLTSTLQSINGHCDIIPTTNCNVPLNTLLGVEWFSGKGNVSEKTISSSPEPGHNSSISSVTVRTNSIMNKAAVELFLSKLVSKHAEDLYRFKGFMEVAGSLGRQYLFQGVHQIFGGELHGTCSSGKLPCELVFIGRNLDKSVLQKELDSCSAFPLRFSPSDSVKCQTPGGWISGTVLSTWTDGNPYLVQLESGIENILGMKVYAPIDNDTFIKPVTDD